MLFLMVQKQVPFDRSYWRYSAIPKKQKMGRHLKDFHLFLLLKEAQNAIKQF